MSIVKGLLPTALVRRACKYFAAALPSLRQERVNELADGMLQYKTEPDVQALLQAIDSKARGGPGAARCIALLALRASGPCVWVQ